MLIFMSIKNMSVMNIFCLTYNRRTERECVKSYNIFVFSLSISAVYTYSFMFYAKNVVSRENRKKMHERPSA